MILSESAVGLSLAITSRRPASSRSKLVSRSAASSSVVEMITGTFADSGGAAGSNGWCGSTASADHRREVGALGRASVCACSSCVQWRAGEVAEALGAQRRHQRGGRLGALLGRALTQRRAGLDRGAVEEALGGRHRRAASRPSSRRRTGRRSSPGSDRRRSWRCCLAPSAARRPCRRPRPRRRRPTRPARPARPPGSGSRTRRGGGSPSPPPRRRSGRGWRRRTSARCRIPCVQPPPWKLTITARLASSIPGVQMLRLRQSSPMPPGPTCRSHMIIWAYSPRRSATVCGEIWRIADRFAHARPGRRRPWRRPAVRAAGRRPVGDALELLDPGVLDAQHLAGRGLGREEDLPARPGGEPGRRRRGGGRLGGGWLARGGAERARGEAGGGDDAAAADLIVHERFPRLGSYSPAFMSPDRGCAKSVV